MVLFYLNIYLLIHFITIQNVYIFKINIYIYLYLLINSCVFSIFKFKSTLVNENLYLTVSIALNQKIKLF